MVTFWVMRKQRVRVLLVRCHSSFTVLSRIRPRSPEEVQHHLGFCQQQEEEEEEERSTEICKKGKEFLDASTRQQV